MTTKSNQSGDWEPCDAGLLTSIASRTKAARRQRTAIRAGVGAVAILLVAGAIVWMGEGSVQPRENYFGGIACHEVSQQMDAYLAGTLPDEVKGRIEAHLRQCPMCREMMQKMQAIQAVMRDSHDHWACDCPECQRQFTQAVSRTLPQIESEGIVAAFLPLQALASR